MNMMIRFSFCSICAYLITAYSVIAYADNTDVSDVSDVSNRSRSSSQTDTIEQSITTTQAPTQTEHTAATSKQSAAHADTTTHINVKALTKRLRTTHAIGFFTKLAIRNDIVDLTDSIKRYRKQSKLAEKLNIIRASFDGLLLKIVALLDEDPDLSRDLYVGREQIWRSLLEEKA